MILIRQYGNGIHFPGRVRLPPRPNRQTDWIGGFPDGCTSITVGKHASSDGFVLYVAHRRQPPHPVGDLDDASQRPSCRCYHSDVKRSPAIPRHAFPTQTSGSVKYPGLPHVCFHQSAYPCMNEHRWVSGNRPWRPCTPAF